MHAGDEDYHCNRYPSFGPISHAVISCNEYVLREYDAAGCCDVYQDGSLSTQVLKPSRAGRGDSHL